MAYSYQTHTGDGHTVDYILTIPYLDKSHITATVGTNAATFTWTTDALIKMDTAPALASLLTILRTTPRTVQEVVFSDASAFTASDLNISALQCIYLAQEAFDSTDSSYAQTCGTAAYALEAAHALVADSATFATGAATATYAANSALLNSSAAAALSVNMAASATFASNAALLNSSTAAQLSVNMAASATFASNSALLNGSTAAQLSVGTASNSTTLNGSTAAQLSVNMAASATFASNSALLDSSAAAALSVNMAASATFASNSALLDSSSAANLSVNMAASATFASNSALLNSSSAAQLTVGSATHASMADSATFASNAALLDSSAASALSVSYAQTAGTAANASLLGSSSAANLSVNMAASATFASNSALLDGSAAAALSVSYASTAGSAGDSTLFAGSSPSAFSYSGHTHTSASTSAAGFLPTLDGSTSTYLRGDGTWQTPAGGGGGTAATSLIFGSTTITMSTAGLSDGYLAIRIGTELTGINPTLLTVGSASHALDSNTLGGSSAANLSVSYAASGPDANGTTAGMVHQSSSAYGIALSSGVPYIDINSLAASTAMASTDFVAIQDGGTTTAKLSLANLARSVNRSIALATTGSATEMATIGGLYENEMVLAYGTSSTTFNYTIYAWRTVATTAASVPYIIASTNAGGGQWWAVAGTYKQGVYYLNSDIVTSGAIFASEYGASNASTTVSQTNYGSWYETVATTTALATYTLTGAPNIQRTIKYSNSSANGTKIVVSGGSAKIRFKNVLSAAAGYIVTYDVGATINMQGNASNEWVITAIRGNWYIDGVYQVHAGIDYPDTNGGRLSLSSTTGVPATDTIGTSATTLYYHPYVSNKISLNNGSMWAALTFASSGASLSLASTTADTNYDVFAIKSGTTIALEIAAWTVSTGTISDATGTQTVTITTGTNAHGLAVNDVVAIRSVGGKTEVNGVFNVTGTAATTFDVFCYATNTYTSGGTWSKANTARTGYSLARQDGALVKSTDVTRKHIGWLRIGETAGQSEDSGNIGTADQTARKFVVNRYNKIKNRFGTSNATSHTYASATARPWNNLNVVRCEFMYDYEAAFNVIIAGRIVCGGDGQVMFSNNKTNTGAGFPFRNAASGTGVMASGVVFAQSNAAYSEGFNFLQAMESSVTAASTTMESVNLTMDASF